MCNSLAKDKILNPQVLWFSVDNWKYLCNKDGGCNGIKMLEVQNLIWQKETPTYHNVVLCETLSWIQCNTIWTYTKWLRWKKLGCYWKTSKEFRMLN